MIAIVQESASGFVSFLLPKRSSDSFIVLLWLAIINMYTISNALLLLLIGADGMPLLQLVLDE